MGYAVCQHWKGYILEAKWADNLILYKYNILEMVLVENIIPRNVIINQTLFISYHGAGSFRRQRHQ